MTRFLAIVLIVAGCASAPAPAPSASPELITPGPVISLAPLPSASPSPTPSAPPSASAKPRPSGRVVIAWDQNAAQHGMFLIVSANCSQPPRSWTDPIAYCGDLQAEFVDQATWLLVQPGDAWPPAPATSPGTKVK